MDGIEPIYQQVQKDSQSKLQERRRKEKLWMRLSRHTLGLLAVLWELIYNEKPPIDGG